MTVYKRSHVSTLVCWLHSWEIARRWYSIQRYVRWCHVVHIRTIQINIAFETALLLEYQYSTFSIPRFQM